MNVGKKASTNETLRDWAQGNPGAERLAAAILILEGYREIDPQHPLGGPDGGKDILCTKDGKTYVGAVYFPYGEKTFTTVRKKFLNDLKGAKKAGVDDIIFVTNQSLSQAQRQKLSVLAAKQDMLCEPVHRERIRVQLDSNAGYGARLQFLGIEMAAEEQFAYFTENDRQLERAIQTQTREIARLARLVEQLNFGQREIVHTMAVLRTPPSAGEQNDIPVPDLLRADTEADAVSANLTIGLLLTMHRMACSEARPEVLGHLRNVPVYFATGAAQSQSADDLKPPGPEAVSALLQGLLDRWNTSYESLTTASTSDKLRALAVFHAEFLRIHPFADGNGRVARSLLVQQCIDLLGKADSGLFDQGVAYQRAVRLAMKGKPEALSDLVNRMVFS
jgi:hypothetical protein